MNDALLPASSARQALALLTLALGACSGGPSTNGRSSASTIAASGTTGTGGAVSTTSSGGTSANGVSAGSTTTGGTATNNTTTGGTATGSSAASTSGGLGTSNGASTGTTTGAFVSAPHGSLPVVPNYGGPLLSSMTLVTIAAQNDAWVSSLLPFGSELAQSAWWSEVGAPYGIGPAQQTLSVQGPPITANVDGPQVVSYIEGLLDAGSVPPPNGQTLYLVFLPDGISLTDVTGSSCAYHKAFPSLATTLGDDYGAVTRCSGTATPILENATRLASHEVMEAATDPTFRAYTLGEQPPQPWLYPPAQASTGPSYVELGDLCEGTRIAADDAGLVAQRIWSDSAADAGLDPCIPPLAVPYFNVSVDQPWVAVSSTATSVAIPLTGWSTAATGDWLVSAEASNYSSGFAALSGHELTPTSALGVETPDSCNVPAYGFNNGVTGQLLVPLPAGLAPGDFMVIELDSQHVDSSCSAIAGEDFYHSSYLGVYVPLQGPLTCGVFAFDEACQSHPAYCPENGTCGLVSGCDCDASSTALDCDGTPCSQVDGGCAFPSWWCAPRQAGACNAQNFTVACPGAGGSTFYCPTNSTCGTSGCNCAAGYTAKTCGGATCSGDCSYPNWWCD